MKKRFSAYALSGVLVLSMAGCAGATENTSASAVSASEESGTSASSEGVQESSVSVSEASESAESSESSEEEITVSGGKITEELIGKMSRNTVNAGSSILSSDDIYSDMIWESEADKYPLKYDLRDEGVVTSVKSQGNWGVCWTFSAIAASETSILSSLGLTAEEYKDLSGIDMDLSERQLAWFGLSHLPEASEYEEGEYPYDVSQAGEGMYIESENPASTETEKRFLLGGVPFMAASAFSQGTGPIWEELVPYQANEDSEEKNDWSLPEEERYEASYQLLNSSLLPSPSGRDENGAYEYNEAGTEAIKEELLAGRAVSCGYHSDMSLDPEALQEKMKKKFENSGWFEEEEIETAIQIASGAADPQTEEEYMILAKIICVSQEKSKEEMTDEELQKMAASLKYANEHPEEVQNNSESDSAKEEAQRAAAEEIGIDYDEYLVVMSEIRSASADSISYMNTDTYAQYVDDIYAQADHAVTIVGWDDDYDVSNFPADHQPPANGAWIVKNNWGTAYGNDGYFYLSYYDQSISMLETFEYDVSEQATSSEKVGILSYSNMNSEGISSVKMNEPVSMANEFTVDEECVLSAVSVLTTGLNSSVTAEVYVLDEDASSPTDGVLIDTVTKQYKYAGYHRIALNQNYHLSKGETISIVETERIDTTEGEYYAVPYTMAATQEYAEIKNVLMQQDEICYQKAVVNEGESFILLDDWTDWSSILNILKAEGGIQDFFNYDNLSIKAYVYMADDIYAEVNVHDQ